MEPRSLVRPALKWLGSLKPGSISSFSSLVNKFYDKFEGSPSSQETSDLYGVVQGPIESVRDYYNCFNNEMISIKDLDTKTATECYRKGLILRSKLYNRLTKYPCQTFEEVKARALAQMRLEGDNTILNTIYTRCALENPNDRKTFTPKKNNWRSHPYSRPNQVHNVVDVVHNVGIDTRMESPTYPDLEYYGFSIDVGGVLNALTTIGAPIGWPRKSD